MDYGKDTAHALAETLRRKAKSMVEQSENEWSGEVLHTLIGDFAGYITGVADGIDFWLAFQKQKEEKE